METITDSGLRRRVKIHVSAKEHTFFAVVQPGFEHTLAAEMKSSGINVSPEFIEGGVEFTGKTDDLYRACISLRGASRIVLRLGVFRSAAFRQLEREIAEFPWELYLPYGCIPVFRTTASKSMIWHTDKLEGIFSAGIAGRMSEHSKPEYFITQSTGITQTIIIRNHKDRCSISLDASGGLLHKRSGSKHITAAPLRETTAALILMEAGLAGYDLLVDPMCGSGTFSIEAASILSGMLPALDREFPFFSWPCFKRNNFEYIKRRLSAESGVVTGKSLITCDIDQQAVRTAVENIPGNLRDMVKPEIRDFFSIKADVTDGRKTLLVLNPPYGKRIGEDSIKQFYRRIGEKLSGDLAGCGFAVIVPGADVERDFNCRYDRKVLFMNGGIRVAVLFRESAEKS